MHLSDVMQVPEPKGYLVFKAIKTQDGDRIVYNGSIPIYPLITQQFIAPVASEGLSEEILKKAGDGPVQRKTNPAHVQGIVDYIVEQAEKAEPWTFNSIVLYSTDELDFEGQSIGYQSVGDARIENALSVGEGLHRALAWAVAIGHAKVRGVKRPEMSKQAQKRIERALIPALVIEEKDLGKQKSDFNKLNQQKPLTATVLSLTDADSKLTDLTKGLIESVPLFKGRIDLNNASVGAKSDKLLSFAQLRFVVASYLLGNKTRDRKKIEMEVEAIVDAQGEKAVSDELKGAFTIVATKLGGLEKLQSGVIASSQAGDFIRDLRKDKLLASNAAWRALFVALHDAKKAGISVETAMTRIRKDPMLWARDNPFWMGNLIDAESGKLLSNRESIEGATQKLLTDVIEVQPVSEGNGDQ